MSIWRFGSSGRPDLSSFPKFRKSLSASKNQDIWFRAMLDAGDFKHIAEETWELPGVGEFRTPGNDERGLAYFYAVYLRSCARKGVAPGPFVK